MIISDKNPTTCSGHFADYPSGWTSYSEPRIYHLGMALENDGTQECGEGGSSGGWTYQQLKDLWYAANATRSNILMMWWSPEESQGIFRGTDYEFVRVSMPSASQECIEHRIEPWQRCSDDLEERVGDPRGVCEDVVRPLQKLTSRSVYDMTFDPSIPDALISPSYDVLDRFMFSELQLNDIIALWQDTGSKREGVCRWAADNVSFLKSLIPPSHPRTFQEEKNGSDALVIACVVLGALALVLILVTSYKVYVQRNRPVMKSASVNFVFLLLAGSFLLAIGAIVVGSPPSSDAGCIAEQWLINLGYSLELVPLVVKIAALNKLLSASKKMQKIKLTRKGLFGAVAAIGSVVLIFLILWTAVDPPRVKKEYTLLGTSDYEGENDDNNIALIRYYCSSESDWWSYLSISWVLVLLFCASVLAFQTRSFQSEYNESRTVSFLIYSHLIFALLRLVTYVLPSVSQWDLARYRSLLFSFDTACAILIYFLPKFLAKDNKRRSTSGNSNAAVSSGKSRPRAAEDKLKYVDKHGRHRNFPHLGKCTDDAIDGLTRAAENGDCYSMYALGNLHYSAALGSDGITSSIFSSTDREDHTEAAYRWYEKAAERRHIQAMAMSGEFLLHGVVSEDLYEEEFCQGIVYTTTAAELGSDVACFNLGYAFYKGSDNPCFMYCLPKDDHQAKYWLEKSLGECTEKHVSRLAVLSFELLLQLCPKYGADH